MQIVFNGTKKNPHGVEIGNVVYTKGVVFSPSVYEDPNTYLRLDGFSVAVANEEEKPKRGRPKKLEVVHGSDDTGRSAFEDPTEPGKG